MLTGFLLSATPAWAFKASDLAQYEPMMVKALFVLGPLALGLGIWEFIEMRKGGSDGLTLDIDRLAAAAAQKQARAMTPEPEPSIPASQDSGGHRAVAPPPPPRGAGAPPPPPPPPARGAVPPPPSPRGATDSGDVSPFARLSQIGQSEEAGGATKASPPGGRPIGLPSSAGSAPPPPPPPATSGGAPSAGGGWADLLQRVRSGEPDAGGGASPPPPPPATPSWASKTDSKEEERPAAPSFPGVPAGFPSAAPPLPPAASGGGSGSDAWEALLKKTTAGSSPPPPGGSSSLGRSGSAGDSNPLSKLNLPSAGGESGAGSNPFASLGGGSGEGLGGGSSQDEALPDFVKKASRTISLDLKKGGGSTPPPPLPKTEG